MRKNISNALVAGAILNCFSFGQSIAQQTSCTLGDDQRTLEVLIPGNIGKACDLKYTYNNGATVKTPYRANNSKTFCAEKMDTILSGLMAQGYDCNGTSKTVAEKTVTTSPSVENVGAVISAVSEGPKKTAKAKIPGTPKAMKARAKSQGLRTSQSPSTGSSRSHSVADGGPIALVAENVPTPQIEKPTKSAVGLMMGAEPANRSDAAKAVLRDADDSGTSSKAMRIQKIRPDPDIIRSVLAAQAAAWNEGDLEAFMGGYWNSPDLRFVSGADVTSGWNKTLKRYRSRYSTKDEMGVLEFSKLDVEMISDNVAVVVGKFDLEKKSRMDTGIFTLVMKRIDGRWRIVHDHTSAAEDAPTP